MDYIITISPQGTKIFYETYNIKDISLIQPMNIMDGSFPHYFAIITYQDGSKEKVVISHEQWEMWNRYQTEGKQNENK